MPQGASLYRIYREKLAPWWFSRSGSGRFDPIHVPDLGACYFAEHPEGCFLEVFRSFTAAVPQGEIDARRLARIELPRDLILADCTSSQARFWGITAEVHSTPWYQQTQLWASALARSGFDGIRYLLRHDPSQHMAGIALFGPAGPDAAGPIADSGLIDPDLLQRVQTRYGITTR